MYAIYTRLWNRWMAMPIAPKMGVYILIAYITPIALGIGAMKLFGPRILAFLSNGN